MRRRLLLIVSIVAVFGVLTGTLSIWRYNQIKTTFAADGYILAEESDTDTVTVAYFASGTAYRTSSEGGIVFESSLGGTEKVSSASYIHYTDVSISALQEGMLADLDEVTDGLLEFYYLAEKMVMTNSGEIYTIDNNDTQLSFTNFLWVLSEDKFLVQAGDGMTLTLANGSEHEITSGYFEIEYPEENIVQIANEDSLWRSVAEGCFLTLNNGVTIDLGTRSVLDATGETVYTISDVALDLASGTGIAVQSTSATSWTPPTFEFNVVDGEDGEDGESGAAGEAGEAVDEGEDGQDGDAGDDGDAGEAGEDGESGESGGDGSSGTSGGDGSSGTSGGDGSSGTDGSSGSSGTDGASGSSGSTASSSSSSSGELGSALGQVLISYISYDCSTVTFDFYAEDTDTLQYQDNYVEIIETSTGRVVVTMEYDEYEGFDTAIPESNSDNQIELTYTGLSPDTEYRINIYCQYRVTSASGDVTGTKAFATRTFYTASEGVTMEASALDQASVQVTLELKDYSTANTARLKVTFEGADEDGETKYYTLWSDIINLNDSTQLTQVFSVLDDDEASLIGLSSNIPYTVTLYTSDALYTSETINDIWEVDGLSDNWASEDSDGEEEPQGYEASVQTVFKSGQTLSGSTLKATPTAGSLVYKQSGDGYYSIYLNGLVDNDNAIESYTYKIYSIDTDNDDALTLVQTKSTTSSQGIELYVDEDVIQYNTDYVVQCTISYNDNEKDYTLMISSTMTTGTGEAVVWFEPADTTLFSTDDYTTSGLLTYLPDYVYNYDLSVGPSWMYGCLVVNTSLAGYTIDENATITVVISSGSDYSKTIYYEPASTTDYDNYTTNYYDALADGYVYDEDTYLLYLPVNIWGLEAESYYSFQVSGNVKYSDATSTTKNLGTAIYATTSYSEVGETGTVNYNVENVSDDYGEMAFAVSVASVTGVSSSDDSYPIEVNATRAIEITAYSSNLEVDSCVIDLYSLYYYTDTTTSVWCTSSSPLAQYLDGEISAVVSDSYEEDSSNPSVLLVVDAKKFSVDLTQYTSITMKVTAVYDYTYNSSTYFTEECSSNISGYANELPFTTTSDTYENGGVEPSLPSEYEGAVSFVPLVNSTSATGTAYSITSDGVAVDPALDSDTIRGYRLSVDYTSTTIDTITYYLFLYDDWADYNDCLTADGGAIHSTSSFADIVQAGLAADAGEDDADSYWADKIISIEINLDDWGVTTATAPGLDIIYTTNDELLAETGKGQEGLTQNSAGTFIYYTDQLERGQTYMVAYTVLDGYTTDSSGEADYNYPYDNKSYSQSNVNLLRTAPMQMDRQSPLVQLTLDHTDENGLEYWNFEVYDPDSSLGQIDVATNDEIAGDGQISHVLTTWLEAYTEAGGYNGVDWENGFIMSSSYSTSTDTTSDLVTYVSNDYSMETVPFPDTAMTALTMMSSADIASAFSGYSQGSNDTDITINENGAGWSGSFTVDMYEETPAAGGLYYLFLGRSLNDSTYTTRTTSAVNSPGLGYTHPSLFTMAAASRYCERIYSEEDLITGTEGAQVIATMDTNNLNFRLSDSTSTYIKNRIAALEVTVYQETATSNVYELLETTVVSFDPTADGTAARLELGNLSGYTPSRSAYAVVRIIYDTGLYGTNQTVYIEDATGYDSDTGTSTKTTLVGKNGDSDITITLWSFGGSTAYYPYSVREQSDDTWYTRSSSSQLNSYGSVITNSIWKLWDYTLSGSTLSMKAYRTNYTGLLGTDNLGYQTTLTLTEQTVVGDWAMTDSTFKAAATAGWNDEGKTEENLVFGALGVVDAAFTAQYTTDLSATSESVTLKLEDGSTVTLSASEAVSFVMPTTEITTSGKTVITPSYNKTNVEFSISQYSYRRLGGTGTSGGSSEVEQAYLPWIFVEIYENTERSSTANSSGYYISNEGTLIDADWTDSNGYLTGAVSIYNTMWNAASTYTYSDSSGASVASGALVGVGAISVDDLTYDSDTGWKIDVDISNLTADLTGDKTYSMRLYVLPLADTNGNAIQYTSSTDLSTYKQYIVDNAGNSSGKYVCTGTTGFHYYTEAKDVWWRLYTKSPSYVSALSATYEVSGYSSKELEVKLSFNNTLTTSDLYVEYRLLDASGNVVLDNADLMAVIGSGYTAAAVTYTDYYLADGSTGSRIYTGYKLNTSVYGVYSTVTFELSDYLGSVLETGVTYTLQARLCYKDPTLIYGANATLFTTDSLEWADEADGVTLDAIVAMGYTTANTASTTITIDAGYSATMDATASYSTSSSSGMDMTVSVSVSDNSYRLGAYTSSGTLTDGAYYVKVYGNAETVNGVTYSEEELSAKFGTLSGSTYKTYTAGTLATFIYSANTQYGRSYYIEIWGVYDGIQHTSDGTCSCGTKHTSDEVDAYGNICLMSSKSNSTITSRLTMTDASGIKILSVYLSYIKSSRTLSIQVTDGTGYTSLTKAQVTITNNGVSYSTTGTLTWSGSTCSLVFDDTSAANISGTSNYTIYFYDSDNNEYSIAGTTSL
ncbi:MAG: hypothetical protein LUE63_02710 [Lachnospiraceae bacterium]|nr:hypothetical protein [Lachnospiraceae bacterium]